MTDESISKKSGSTKKHIRRRRNNNKKPSAGIEKNESEKKESDIKSAGINSEKKKSLSRKDRLADKNENRNSEDSKNKIDNKNINDPKKLHEDHKNSNDKKKATDAKKTTEKKKKIEKKKQQTTGSSPASLPPTAQATTSSQTSSPNAKSKPKRKRKNKKSANKLKDLANRHKPHGFKLVVRLLPPNLTEEQFIETIEPALGKDFKEKFNIFQSYYVQGESNSTPFHGPVHSRAYFILENMEDLKKLGEIIQKLEFIDDKDNLTRASLLLSPYVKDLVDESLLIKKPSKANSKVGEGTLQNDPLFKTFLKATKLMKEEKDHHYAYNDFSLFKSLEEEESRQLKNKRVIKLRSKDALVRLAGAENPLTPNATETETDNKPKKKKKRKSKKEKLSEDVLPTSTQFINSPKKSKKKKGKDPVEKNNNIVILEEAGKRELQKRKKLAKKTDLKMLPGLSIGLPSPSNSTASSNKWALK
ncbi:hypothetical protein TBLA_0F01000 [Henningerozyma blattae CBS 6284]|uniref:UPF3 domain-containing protein n=1 Tax=Henningerozyma blattae (strain ATCC 34711 / CBS 6284 / DSM 70876 / NBRC 10599 / NRRL Y-10934 / UCD 77-7) TaxID=1071380 RepID=I2H5J1_HENB6|nr:hypothetical protein TBLA_0F01000 [Tetrapisispora blattae CBS 6284]CCH61643.1 hypothetical protein TBLA_0F01000 [Tetrapisispora blattae CBS 6284]